MIVSHFCHTGRKFSLACLAAAWLLLPGCTKVGPDYVAPTLDQDIQVDVAEGEYLGVLPEQADIRNWWQVFDDQILTDLINEAVANNLDIRMALSRLDESRARLGISNADFMPTGGAGAGTTRGRGSEAATGVAQSIYNQYGVSMDASWEIDIWGKVRRGVEASSAEYQASEEETNDVLITICADVARLYFTIRTLQSRVTITTNNIANQEKIVQLTQDRFDAGIGSTLELAQATRVYATSQSSLPPLRTSLAENINSLSVVLGQQPGYVNDKLAPLDLVPLPPSNVAIGIPAEQIRNRPDVRQAERQLAAQTARIGVAKADLYPSLALNGSVGTSSLSGGDLFTGGSSLFSFGPTLKLNLFNRKAIRDQIKVEDARTEQALANYEKILLLAVKDVEDSLVAYHEQQLQLTSLDQAQLAGQTAMAKSQDLYTSGLIGFQNVLDAERALLEVENAYEDGRGNTSILLVRLYRSLAGGWAPEGAVAIDAEPQVSEPARLRNSEQEMSNVEGSK